MCLLSIGAVGFACVECACMRACDVWREFVTEDAYVRWIQVTIHFFCRLCDIKYSHESIKRFRSHELLMFTISMKT